MLNIKVFSPNTLINNTYILSGILLLFLLSISLNKANAFEKPAAISLANLGDFQTTFSTIEPTSYLESHSLVGQVTYRTGENYTVLLPFDIQKIRYLVKNGFNVEKGAVIAQVEGYDVHHFLEEYQSVKALFLASEQHYSTNKRHFNDKTLTGSEWLDISQNYFAAKLKLEHFEHQLSFLHIDENEQVFFISPEGGVVNLQNVDNSKSTGELAFEIINQDSIKVKVNVPLTSDISLAYLRGAPTCVLTIDSIDKLANKYHQTLWATPNSEHCNFTLGQTLTVTPVYHFKGYKVAKSAIFEFNDLDYIAVKAGDTLQLYPVQIVSTDQESAYINAEQNIESLKVLTSSVSIVQGILLELGAE